jgi:SMODS and SLOG-associating 2TM effector domain 1/Protein of unknown function (DUF4231)
MHSGGGSTTNDVLTWAWDKQSQWSQAAGNLKKSLFLARKIALWLAVSAAVLATLTVQLAGVSPAWGRGLALAAAVAAAFIPVAQRSTSRTRVQDWTRARSVSEALKAEVYRFMAGVAPYRGTDRQEVFTKRTGQFLSDAHELTRLTVGILPKPRALPQVSDVDSYITERVRQQMDTYYREQSAEMKRLGDRYRTIVNVLAFVAVLLGVAASSTGTHQFAGWAPVVTTVIAAVAAYSAVNRFDALMLEYSRTYEQLERLLLERPRAAGPDRQAEEDRFVAEAEAVISVQNESWMARSVEAVDAGDRGGSPESPAAQAPDGS